MKKIALTFAIVLLASMGAADMEFRSSNPIDVYSQFNMHSNPIVNLEAPDEDGDAQDSDALNLGYANSLYLQRSGDWMNGSLDMNGNYIQNLPYPINTSNPATKGYVDDEVGSVTGSQNLSQVLEQGSTANQSIDMDNHDIVNLEAPDRDSDAVNRGYVLDNYLNRNGDSMNGSLDMNGSTIRNAGIIESPVISGQLDLDSSRIVNVAPPSNPEDVVTLSYFNTHDSEGSDNQTLSVQKVNGEDTDITIENGNTVTVDDYYEADTNASTICADGEYLNGDGTCDTINGADGYIGDSGTHTAGGKLDMNGNNVNMSGGNITSGSNELCMGDSC